MSKELLKTSSFKYEAPNTVQVNLKITHHLLKIKVPTSSGLCLKQHLYKIYWFQQRNN